eukprot:1182314-Prorocentrum_minimum.AAC.4
MRASGARYNSSMLFRLPDFYLSYLTLSIPPWATCPLVGAVRLALGAAVRALEEENNAGLCEAAPPAKTSSHADLFYDRRDRGSCTRSVLLLTCLLLLAAAEGEVAKWVRSLVRAATDVNGTCATFSGTFSAVGRAVGGQRRGARVAVSGRSPGVRRGK